MPIENEKVEFDTRNVHLASYTISEQMGSLGTDEDFFKDAMPFYKKGDEVPAGYVIHSEGNTLVSYRGTGNYRWDEWADNLSALSTPMDLKNGEKVHVHAGFKHEYDLSKESMEKAVKEMENKHGKGPMSFVGHSMGAAVSQIAALDQKTKNKDLEIDVINFGSPRVFCTNAAKVYNKHLGDKTLRVKQEGDPVTHVPPKLAYNHVGHHITMAADKACSTHMPDAYLDISSKLAKKYDQGPLTKDDINQEAQNRSSKGVELKKLGKEIRKERTSRMVQAFKEAATGNPKIALTTARNITKQTELKSKKLNTMR